MSGWNKSAARFRFTPRWEAAHASRLPFRRAPASPSRWTPSPFRRVIEMAGPRVLVADDDTILLEAFQKLLEPECDIVGQVTDGRALVAAAEKLKPDVIVLDIGMPLLNGLEAGRQAKQVLRDVKLVFLTMYEDADLAAEAF